MQSVTALTCVVSIVSGGHAIRLESMEDGNQTREDGHAVFATTKPHAVNSSAQAVVPPTDYEQSILYCSDTLSKGDDNIKQTVSKWMQEQGKTLRVGGEVDSTFQPFDIKRDKDIERIHLDIKVKRNDDKFNVTCTSRVEIVDTEVDAVAKAHEAAELKVEEAASAAAEAQRQKEKLVEAKQVPAQADKVANEKMKEAEFKQSVAKQAKNEASDAQAEATKAVDQANKEKQHFEKQEAEANAAESTATAKMEEAKAAKEAADAKGVLEKKHKVVESAKQQFEDASAREKDAANKLQGANAKAQSKAKHVEEEKQKLEKLIKEARPKEAKEETKQDGLKSSASTQGLLTLTVLVVFLYSGWYQQELLPAY